MFLMNALSGNLETEQSKQIVIVSQHIHFKGNTTEQHRIIKEAEFNRKYKPNSINRCFIQIDIHKTKNVVATQCNLNKCLLFSNDRVVNLNVSWTTFYLIVSGRPFDS